MNSKKHFLLFSTCIPVKGYESSLIMDLDRAEYLDIPNELHDILVSDLHSNTIEETKSLFNNEFDKGIDQYFQFLVDNHYGFYTANPSPFQKLPLQFDSPHKIISSVIVISKESDYDLVDVFTQLHKLDCQLLQIRVYDKVELAELLTALQVLQRSSLRIIELFIPSSLEFTTETLKHILSNFPRILITVYAAQESKRVKVLKNSSRDIRFTTQKLTNNSEEVSYVDLLTVSHEMYFEAVNYNTGLYRKVCVDYDGSIKNYISHTTSFGNVKNDLIFEIIQKEEFTKKYYLNNDNIEKCKDCKFRYMCLSNSDIEKKNNQYHKVDSCSYDPYTGNW